MDVAIEENVYLQSASVVDDIHYVRDADDGAWEITRPIKLTNKHLQCGP